MAATRPVERNKELIERLYDEFMNAGEDDLLRELYADDVVVHDVPGGGGELRGLDELEPYLENLRETFPDLEVTVNEMVAEDDLVVVRNSYTGTHEGTFMDTPATGETVTFDGMVFFRIEEGRVAETWGLTDTLAIMQQLGVSEVPAA